MMSRYTVCFGYQRRSPLGVLLLAVLIVDCALMSTAFGQPRSVEDVETLELAPFVAPSIGKAVVIEREGHIFIQIWAAELLRGNQDRSKDGRGWVHAWTELEQLELDKDIHAFKPSGEKIERAAILEALKKPTTVACFARTNKADPQTPDPLYAKAFRDNLVLLVFDAKYWLSEPGAR